MADYGSDDSNEAAVSDGSGSEADLGTDKPMEKTKYLGPEWTGQKAEHADWQWEVDPYMEDAGFKAVMSEKGRKLAAASNPQRTVSLAVSTYLRVFAFMVSGTECEE